MSGQTSPASLPPVDRNESMALLIRRGSSGHSQFGSLNIHYDYNGVYLSSLVVTILIFAITTTGIFLIALGISLSLMQGNCHNPPDAVSAVLQVKSSRFCDGFIMNAEVNNLQGWFVSKDCVPFVARYMTEGQYTTDFAGAIAAAADYLESIPLKRDGSEVVVMDIDETVLSNMPYYVRHNFGGDIFDENEWNEWVYEIAGLPLNPALALYNQLKAGNIGVVFLTGRPEEQRNVTAANLKAAGYEGWVDLLLRSPLEIGLKAVEYKSNRRFQIEQQGYRILASFGDQWSDLIGPAAGKRTFKLPNPMYYIF